MSLDLVIRPPGLELIQQGRAHAETQGIERLDPEALFAKFVLRTILNVVS